MTTVHGTGMGTAYGHRQAAVYDAVYGGRGKDWITEGDELAALIREHCPEATSVLDVACGTGSHLRLDWQRRGATMAGRFAVTLVVLTRGWLVKRSFQKGLRSLETSASP